MMEMDDEEDQIGHLEEEAKKRRERIEQIKRSSQHHYNEDNGQAANKAHLPRPQFRSYIPVDEALSANVIEKTIPEPVDAQVKDQMDIDKVGSVVQEIDLSNLAPRKVDWDLKRNINKKLDKLEKRTQRTIAELIRERLKESIEQ